MVMILNWTAAISVIGWSRVPCSMHKRTHGHLGEFDPKTGEQTKPPKPGRTTKT
ncbi:hypothetical protein CQ054_21235 [Ochrobactrum sp. MYb29]|uniref:colicin E3/pyocin S6 family cytotoxin n=1 Tax=Brucella pituitosa TaxID=571256 RepID=UPI000C26EA39|nr:hypothetical protein CWE02_09900 [Brucella pituitosa]PRA80233.1 hypothetical protein CQ054_21235 [Ochrobactrum sp. MYb29]